MVYTVGHSNRDINDFIKIIVSYGINCIVDVRSSPFSKYCHQFNKEVIKEVLQNARIKYLFLGKELGARPDDLSCYYKGRVQFDLLRKTELFKQGIARLKDGEDKGCVVAVMCSEKNPIDCHRTILISRVLKENGIELKHIISETESIDQNQLEEQLLKKFKMEPTLFDTENAMNDRIVDAYKKQEEHITYTLNMENTIESEH